MCFVAGLVTPSSDIDFVVFNAGINAQQVLARAMYRRQNAGEVSSVVCVYVYVYVFFSCIFSRRNIIV